MPATSCQHWLHWQVPTCPENVEINGRSFASQVLGEESAELPRPWCFTQYYKTRVLRDQRFKMYSTGEFYDLSEDPLEQHNLEHSNALKEAEAAAAFQEFQQLFASFPENRKLPWEFRSISARKIRAEEAAEKLKEQ